MIASLENVNYFIIANREEVRIILEIIDFFFKL